MKETTLAILTDNDHILLGLKKRSFTYGADLQSVIEKMITTR
jgi:hypothetical protein